MSAFALAGRGKILWRLLVIGNIVVIMPVIFVSLAAIDARAELGRWPVPWQDDPKQLILVMPFDELFYLSSPFASVAIFVVLVAGACAIVTGVSRKWRSWITRGLLSVIGPGLLVASFVWYWPMKWILD